MNYLEGTDIDVKEASTNKNYLNMTKKIEVKVKPKLTSRKPICLKINKLSARIKF